MSDQAESKGPREFWIPMANLEFFFRDKSQARVTGANIRMSDNVVPEDAIFFIERCHYDAMKARAELAVTALRKANEQFKSENPIAGLNTVGDFLKKLDDAAKEKS